jgi:hypothetical protein
MVPSGKDRDDMTARLNGIDLEKDIFSKSKIGHPDYSITLLFSCRRAGIRCSINVPRITYDDITVLARFIRRNVDEFIAGY